MKINIDEWINDIIPLFEMRSTFTHARYAEMSNVFRWWSSVRDERRKEVGWSEFEISDICGE